MEDLLVQAEESGVGVLWVDEDVVFEREWDCGCLGDIGVEEIGIADLEENAVHVVTYRGCCDIGHVARGVERLQILSVSYGVTFVLRSPKKRRVGRIWIDYDHDYFYGRTGKIADGKLLICDHPATDEYFGYDLESRANKLETQLDRIRIYQSQH